MDALWVLLMTGSVMVAYLVVVVRAANRGKQWAIDVLKATSCLVGPGAAPAWLTLEHHSAEWVSEQAAESVNEPDSELVA